MNPLLVIAIPMTLIIIGIVLNGLSIVFDQPEYSLEADPVNKLAAERHANSRYFFLQRERILKRQKRVGQFGWLVLAAVVACSWLLHADAVKATEVSKQISAIQTLAAAGGKESVLSLTLKDGSKTQYVVKALKPRSTASASAIVIDEGSKSTAQRLAPVRLGTAVSDGDATVPLGIALKIVN